MKSNRVLISAFILVVINLSSSTAWAKLSLDGKVVVVTGASSGFGKGVAEQMAAMGAHVVLAARRKELLEQLAKRCGHDALAVPTDVGKASDIQNLADIAIQRFGHIDVWINNAGVGALGKFEEIPVEDHSRLIDVNLKGVIYGSHAAITQFKKQGFGTLINVGSIASEVPLAYYASYAASKAGVLSFDRALKQELRLSGSKRIKVVTVMPWAVDTPWWDHAANYSGGTPRMRPMEAPQKVVNAIVKMAESPKANCPVGIRAKLALDLHRLFPDLIEKETAKKIQHYQVDTAPPAAKTAGTLYQPMASGTEVEGVVRERMKNEEK